MRKLLLAAATLFVAPASAQTAASVAPPVPTPSPVAPMTSAPVPTTNGPRPATSAGEVASIVAREFPAYDKDANGGLSAKEFDDWMVRLRAIADPTVTADAPSTRTWLGAAFAQADIDRSRLVTLQELTGFLSPARS
ncbi:EF-hand domain-containing protein [uncultured Sphingomonas sp.]|uniref:EF-hand domain-containing protein n=1 Tax=uncultured Sphingomonas sp. TaxID=158754 RepID=UPI0035C971B9